MLIRARVPQGVREMKGLSPERVISNLRTTLRARSPAGRALTVWIERAYVQGKSQDTCDRE
jgi:hypothetical protein